MKTGIKIVDEQDRNRGLISAVVFGVVLLILLLFLSVSEPDPPLRDIPVAIELSPEMILITSSPSGSDGGAEKSSSQNPNPTPPDMGDRVLTSKIPKPNNKHNSGQGGSTPVQNPNPPQQQPDPSFTFGGDGSGGSGGSGTGPGFGSGAGGSGEGSGGSGTGPARKVIKDPCAPKNSTEDGTIYLSIQIDDQGRVTHATNVSEKSTTSSNSAIEAARRAVLDCMRYEARPGSGPVRTEVRIIVRSN